MDLYNFEGLQKFLGEIIPPPAIPNMITIAPIDVDKMLENGEIEFKQDGIFVTIKGVKTQLFMYLFKYKVNTYNGKLPKAHLIQCSKVESIGNQRYAASCQMLVNVFNSDAGVLLKNKILDICKYCLAETTNIPQRIMNNTECFAKITGQQEEDVDENTPTDINGYTLDWQQISTRYKKSCGYTCVRCGIQMTNTEHQHFIHTHHRNGNKKWNAASNLECLCILCHSNVDDHHKRQFQNNMDLKHFKRIYASELRELDNPYI